jgi:hypothetical protein
MPMFGAIEEEDLAPPDPLIRSGLGAFAVALLVCGVLLVVVLLKLPPLVTEWGMRLSGEYDIPCVQRMTMEVAEEYIRNYDPPLKPFRLGQVRYMPNAEKGRAVVLVQHPDCGLQANWPTDIDVLLGTP